MSEPVLKPCPFCGGEPLIESESGFHSVRCVQCTDTDMNVKVVKFAKVEAVIDVWNNRADEAALEYMLGERANESDLLRKEVERLKETIQGLQKILEYSPTAELKAENTRLRSALEKYADKQNWGRSRSGYADRFMLVEESDCFGWDIASEALKGGAQSTCKWEHDLDRETDVWETSCGNAVVFDEGGPKENGYRHCHYCGRPIVFVEE